MGKIPVDKNVLLHFRTMTCVYVLRNLSYSSVAHVERISRRCFLTWDRRVCCAHSNQKHQTQKRRAPPARTLKGAEHRPQTRRGHETCHWFGVEADSRHFKWLQREASSQKRNDSGLFWAD